LLQDIHLSAYAIGKVLSALSAKIRDALFPDAAQKVAPFRTEGGPNKPKMAHKLFQGWNRNVFAPGCGADIECEMVRPVRVDRNWHGIVKWRELAVSASIQNAVVLGVIVRIPDGKVE
jgi:hypothetical protein